MRKGFEVVMAEDGQKGVDMSISENPDLNFNGFKFTCYGWLAGYINY